MQQRDTNAYAFAFMAAFAFSDLTAEQHKKIPCTIIKKGNNLRFYHSHVRICKAVFFLCKVELGFDDR